MAREYFSIPEAALRLGLSRIAVFKKVKKGQLEALRVGRNWAVPAAALEAAAAVKTARAKPGKELPALAAAKLKKELPAAGLSAADSEMDSMGWD